MTADVIRWRCRARVDKYLPGGAEPHEVLERNGNLLMYGGASLLWQCLIGNGTSTAGQNLTYPSASNAYLGVGDSSTAAAADQSDLQASTNKLRRGMNGTYPSHSDGSSSGNASIQFQSTFGSADANFAWAEWALFNASSGGRMINRKVDALGTKSSGNVWVLTVTLSLA